MHSLSVYDTSGKDPKPVYTRTLGYPATIHNLDGWYNYTNQKNPVTKMEKPTLSPEEFEKMSKELGIDTGSDPNGDCEKIRKELEEEAKKRLAREGKTE
jgi:hypothetical protein